MRSSRYATTRGRLCATRPSSARSWLDTASTPTRCSTRSPPAGSGGDDPKEHEARSASHEVWGVPTFIVGDQAAFVRLMHRPDGDAALGPAHGRAGDRPARAGPSSTSSSTPASLAEPTLGAIAARSVPPAGRRSCRRPRRPRHDRCRGPDVAPREGSRSSAPTSPASPCSTGRRTSYGSAGGCASRAPRPPAAPASGAGVRPVAPPEWVDDPDFDLDHHLRHMALPEPGTLRQLSTWPRSSCWTRSTARRPLWEFVVIDGVRGRHGPPSSRRCTTP